MSMRIEKGDLKKKLKLFYYKFGRYRQEITKTINNRSQSALQRTKASIVQ